LSTCLKYILRSVESNSLAEEWVSATTVIGCRDEFGRQKLDLKRAYASVKEHPKNVKFASRTFQKLFIC
jgi:hypothetical protein